MITSKQDALSALRVLFGTTTPRLPDLSTEELNFVEGFINPVVKASEDKVILGYAYVPEKLDRSVLPEIVARPTHALPTGHPILYITAFGEICGECASQIEDEAIGSWGVNWENDACDCAQCGRWLQMLSEYMEGI